jgi:hypothetical protein
LGTPRAEGVTIHFKPNKYDPIVGINREHQVYFTGEFMPKRNFEI